MKPLFFLGVCFFLISCATTSVDFEKGNRYRELGDIPRESFQNLKIGEKISSNLDDSYSSFQKQVDKKSEAFQGFIFKANETGFFRISLEKKFNFLQKLRGKKILAAKVLLLSEDNKEIKPTLFNELTESLWGVSWTDILTVSLEKGKNYKLLVMQDSSHIDKSYFSFWGYDDKGKRRFYSLNGSSKGSYELNINYLDPKDDSYEGDGFILNKRTPLIFVTPKDIRRQSLSRKTNEHLKKYTDLINDFDVAIIAPRFFDRLLNVYDFSAGLLVKKMKSDTLVKNHKKIFLDLFKIPENKKGYQFFLKTLKSPVRYKNEDLTISAGVFEMRHTLYGELNYKFYSVMLKNKKHTVLLNFINPLQSLSDFVKDLLEGGVELKK